MIAAGSFHQPIRLINRSGQQHDTSQSEVKLNLGRIYRSVWLGKEQTGLRSMLPKEYLPPDGQAGLTLMYLSVPISRNRKALLRLQFCQQLFAPNGR